jgi:hypothetical protein
MGRDQPVVVGHDVDLILALGHTALEGLDNVRSVSRELRLQGKDVVEVPRPPDRCALGVEPVEDLQGVPDDADILPETDLVGAITPIRVVEVNVEAERNVNARLGHWTLLLLVFDGCGAYALKNTGNTVFVQYGFIILLLRV